MASITSPPRRGYPTLHPRRSRHEYIVTPDADASLVQTVDTGRVRFPTGTRAWLKQRTAAAAAGVLHWAALARRPDVSQRMQEALNISSTDSLPMPTTTRRPRNFWRDGCRRPATSIWTTIPRYSVRDERFFVESETLTCRRHALDGRDCR